YAAAFAGDLGPRLLAEVVEVTFPKNRARTLPSTPDYNAIRTRLFDDYLTEAASDPAMNQIVVAPAGMDSRAFRLNWPRPVRLFEVDRPVVLAVKGDVLGAAQSVVDRRVVGADLRHDSWPDTLREAGYDPDQPSTWLIEGLLYYIGESDVHRLLETV